MTAGSGVLLGLASGGGVALGLGIVLGVAFFSRVQDLTAGSSVRLGLERAAATARC